MITTDQFKVTSESGAFPPLYLGPYGVAELARYVPVSPDALPYETTDYQELFASTPENILSPEEQHGTDWGIYEDVPTPETFIGIVELCKQQYGNPENPLYSRAIQGVGTLILAPERRNMGIGSLAKLAVIRYAIEEDGTCMFHAETSEHNVAARKSLHKIGFECTASYSHFDFPGGGQTESWALVSPQAQAIIGRAPNSLASQQVLEKGWLRYLTVAQDLKVERT